MLAEEGEIAVREIKIRYTYKRKQDGHIWQIIMSIEGIEDKYNQIFHMRSNNLWKLIGRDLFTGVYDKNNKEIYEEDIVKCWFREYFNNGYGEWDKYKNKKKKDFIGRVYFDEDYRWRAEGINDEGFSPVFDRSSDTRIFEVIGNIYENKELLK